MKKAFRFATIFILLIAITICIPAAKAEKAGGSWGSLKWTLSDSGVLTVTGKGEMKPFESSNSEEAWRAYEDDISSVVIGNGITSVGAHAFSDMPITSVQMPDSVLSINQGAFFGCDQLKSVKLPSKLKKLELWAFTLSAITSVTIPGSVENFGSNVFCNCPNLKKVVFETGTLISLPSRAFMECAVLETVVLPKGLQTIGAECFAECPAIKKITVPVMISYIGDKAFSKKTVIVCVKNTYTDTWATEAGYSVEYNGVAPTSVKMTQKELNIKLSAGKDTKVQLAVKFSPADTTEKEMKWYSDNDDVATVDDKGVVTAHKAGDCVIYAESKINYNMMAYCDVHVTLGSVVAKHGIYRLDDKTKEAVLIGVDNKSITSLTIPDTVKANGIKYRVTGIDKNACKNLKKLAKLTIGKNVKKIGNNAFSGCAKLKTINIKSTAITSFGKKTFKSIYKKATFKCPKSKRAAYEKLIRKAGAPKGCKIK